MENEEVVLEEPTIIITDVETSKEKIADEDESAEMRKPTLNMEDADSDTTIHAFNLSNAENTVLERSVLDVSTKLKSASYEGSDSGVEVAESLCTLQRTLSANSSNSQDFETAQSYESSLISCCSNYEETYNLLARRNSTLIEDYKLRGDGTSEGGSESSSITGSSSSRNSKRVTISKKKPSVCNELKPKQLTPVLQKNRSRPPATPKTPINRSKSINKSHASASKSDGKKSSRAVPSNLPLVATNEKGKSSSRASSTSRTTPLTTPTDDGRWPSIHSRPAPLMARSGHPRSSLIDTPRRVDSKSATLDKYGTLPRRRKEKSADINDITSKQLSSRESSIARIALLKRQSSIKASTPKTLPPYPRRRNTPKTRIFHEISIQTALTIDDVEKALAGVSFNPSSPKDVEKCDKEIQADQRAKDLEKLQAQLQELTDKHDKLVEENKKREKQLNDSEERLKIEKAEKEDLKSELKQNTERVLAILAGDSKPPDDDTSSDSLLVLENRYQQVGQVVVEQEHQISELNAYCRSLKRDLDKSLHTQEILLQQQHDLEADSRELQEFMQTEKIVLTDALKEAETEMKKLTLNNLQKEKEVENKTNEYNRLLQQNDQQRQENMRLQAQLLALEAKVYQQNSISQAGVSALITRLDNLIYELMAAYDISDQELEDAVVHNEAYTQSSSSPDETPDNPKKSFNHSPSPHRGSSLVSAIINAIKHAATHSSQKDGSKDLYNGDKSETSEMLDSETEPCLMMEHVLEDVLLPDGYSHNMVSSTHSLFASPRLVHSESLNNLPASLFSKQSSDHSSLMESLNTSFNSMSASTTEVTTSLVDQIIDVDNLVVKLLKVLRIIQMENEETMNEVQDERDQLFNQVTQQREAGKIVAKQLKDWENLGGHLKGEVNELMEQLSRKNKELDDLKSDLNQHRKEIQRLNEDVCELSTACSKKDIECKIKEEEMEKSIKHLEQVADEPAEPALNTIVVEQKKTLTALREELIEKETKMNELMEEFDASKQVLSGNWKKALTEAEKQYKAIDKALEVLSSVETIVEQCPVLAQLRSDLETICFQTASSIPAVGSSDCNSNSSMLKSVNKLEIPSPINSTA